MINKKVVLSILLSCLAIVLILSVGKGEKEEVVIEEKPAKKAAEQGQEKAQYELVPDDPEVYGMVIIEGGEEYKTQKEWDEFVEDNIKKLKSEVSLETWVQIEEEIKEPPKVTEEKLKEIDKRIGELKATLRREPSNEDVEKRIEDLEILKALTKSLAP